MFIYVNIFKCINVKAEYHVGNRFVFTSINVYTGKPMNMQCCFTCLLHNVYQCITHVSFIYNISKYARFYVSGV